MIWNRRLSNLAQSTLKNRYLLPQESFSGLFKRVARAYGDNPPHSVRMYRYMAKNWFMPATPILSNGGTERGLPISCFVNEVEDSLQGIADTWYQNIWLAAKGGGIGTSWSNVRSIGEKIRNAGETTGIIPFLNVQNSLANAVSQGGLRRGSAVTYLSVRHPEIEEFVEIRKPTGGDPSRKTLHLHHGVSIPDDFMQAVESGSDWDLLSPISKKKLRTISARDLWVRILTARLETGEPYMLFEDVINRQRPLSYQKLDLNVTTSNLCSEITLATGKDHLGHERTGVCCLGSVNLEYYENWSKNMLFVEDCLRFLDNVLSDFVKRAPGCLEHAKYSAIRERSVGLGVMGFHSMLQKKMIPFESVIAKVINRKIFLLLAKKAKEASRKLAEEKGPCEDAKEAGLMERFTHKTCIAPTASISIICGQASPGIEPYVSNAFTQKTLCGSFGIRNKFLADVLEAKGLNDEGVWSSIVTNEGSVQHLEQLSDKEKEVFKTAFEIDQRWVVELAADRAPHIDQAQSINLFLSGKITKRALHQLHFQSWKRGLKSLYYLRSVSVQRADKISHAVAQEGRIEDYDECLSCQ